MDLWVVGAAAAAGYIAKYWQNTSRDRNSSLGSGPSKYEKNESPSLQCHSLTWTKKPAEDTNTVGTLSDTFWLDSASDSGLSSSDYVEKPGNFQNYDDCSILTISSGPPCFTTNGSQVENGSASVLSHHVHDDSGATCTGEMGSVHKSKRKAFSLRTRCIRGHFIKPLNSLESCLMAQLYKEHSEMEEYVLSVSPSPTTKMRPLLVTDGNQIINGLHGDCLTCFARDENMLNKDENVCGVPPLPKIGKVDVPNKIKSKTREACNKRFSSSDKTGRRHFHSQNGVFDRTYLFCLGISVGIASSLLASRREIEKLQDLLKQTENLVQDLQEELEMKDSLTVKELADDNCESQDAFENTSLYKELIPLQIADNAMSSDHKQSQYEQAEVNFEDMSKIEAELEVELERLGLNVNASNLGRKLSDLDELDPDSVAEFAQGDLRVDIVNRLAVNQPKSDQDRSGIVTTHSGNYAVSPRELSLRLHEVIESQLEERVKHLEMALQDSQRKVQLMESQGKSVWRKLSSSELRYFSDEESPVAEEFNPTTEPLVLNLSGEALDAYNEACRELTNMNESEDDDSPTTTYEDNHARAMHPFNHIMTQGYRNGTTKGSVTCLASIKEKPSFVNHLKVAVESNQGIQELLYDGASEDENSSSSDEMEKQLIKQIVEKTRKGSPVVLNAHRVLFSMDDNES